MLLALAQVAETVEEGAADPLPRLLAERAQREREWLAVPETMDGSPVEKAAWDAFAAAEEAIETTVASTPEGVAAQIEYIKLSYGDPRLEPDPFCPPVVEDVPVALLDVMLDGLRRIGQ